MNDIETYKTVTISYQFEENENRFNQNIFIEFQVDEIVLKYVSMDISGGFGVNQMFKITSELVPGDGILAVVPNVDIFHESFNIPFRNHTKNINGTYSFYIKDINNANVPLGRTGLVQLSFTLLFIKWKK